MHSMLHHGLFDIFGSAARDSGHSVCGTAAGLEEAAWHAAAGCAQVHQCVPMFHERLRELGLLDLLPDQVREQLEQALRLTAARNLRGAFQLRELTARLDGRAPLIALKGASLVRTCYRDMSLRPMIDLDVLARDSDLDAAREALKHLGYGQSPRADPSLCSNHDVAYVKSGMYCIELHRSLLGPSEPFTIDPEGLWSRAIPSRDTPGLFHLSLEDLLVHVCLHAGYHHQLDIGLYAFIDIALIAGSPDLDWQRTLERAHQWRAERCVFLMLQLARTLVGAEIPHDVLHELRPQHFDDDVVRRALSVIYNKKPRGYEPTAILAALLTKLIMQGSWRQIPGRIRRRLLRSPETRTRWPNSPHEPTWYGQFAPLATGMVGLATRRDDREHLRSRLDGARVQRWMEPTA